MTKRRSINLKLKQKGGNQGIVQVPASHVRVLPPQPQLPPTPGRQGQWIWQDYNPLGVGDAMMMVKEQVNTTGEQVQKLGKNTKVAYALAGFLFLISYLAITESTIFNQSNLLDPKAAMASPLAIYGFAVTLVICALPSMYFAYNKMVQEERMMNNKGPYSGILGKLKWFFTSPYLFVILLICSIFIVGGQIAGFMTSHGIPSVRNTLHNKMAGTWRGIWSVNAFSTLLFIFFMIRYPFDTVATNKATGKKVHLYDNIHAKGIMLNLLIMSIFFTIYFSVEFSTKYNVI